ncbi:MAG: phosphatase PAP2 family protein [Lentisphaerae bacterium]|nr:phosphatase PAP2 family protein [Lentisphaerota bacterium]MCP4102032.1 phosphatase PAP2 family protein [Lentisphaerota bacterium]
MKNKKLVTCLSLTLTAVILCIISVLYIDKPLSYAMHEVRVSKLYFIFFEMQYIVDIMHKLFPLALIYLIVKYMLGKTGLIDRSIFLLTASCLSAKALKEFLKFVFGRTWAETFKHANPSLIKNGVYKFNFFHGSEIAYQSFPSGHTAVVFAFATALWLICPRARGISVILCLAVIAGLLGCNFHFLSDIIGGAFIGIFSALICHSFISKHLVVKQEL